MFPSVHNWPKTKERLWNWAEDGNTLLYFWYRDLMAGKFDSMFKLVPTVLILDESEIFVKISGIGIRAIFEWNWMIIIPVFWKD